MSDIIQSKINDKNERYVEAISLEAFSNPFKGITDTIKDSLHSVIRNVPMFNTKAANENELGKAMHMFNEKTKVDVIKNVNHIEVKDIMVVVPVGFTGDYLSYFNVLAKQLTIMHDIKDVVVEPTHNLILKYIGKPETMSSIDNSDLDKIKLHSLQIEQFKREMNKYFDPKRSHQSLPVGKLVANTKEMHQLVTDIRNGLLPWMLDVKWRTNLFNSYTKLQQSLDLLMVRIEQKPDEYQLTKLNAERLARLINDVAVEIELTGALFIYTNQLIDCVINLQAAVYSSLEA